MEPLLVTGSPPTPNGDLHVGHLSGPYLAADVFARHQRQRGRRTLYLVGSDDNQSFVSTTARRLGRDPRELARHYTDVIQDTLRAARIKIDGYETALDNAEYTAFVQDFFLDLYRRGELVADTRPAPWCEACRRFVFESFVKGRCPHCGEGANGNLCEACGRAGNAAELVDPRCVTCGGPAVLREYRGIFFPLERHRAALAATYEARPAWRAHTRALCRWLAQRPMADYPASYPGGGWGIPVPVQGFEDQVINVWLEMFPGYVYTTRAWCARRGEPETAERIWSGGGARVHFFGYDNSFCHAVLHAALALASGGRYALPESVVVNEFYFLENDKFSTSQNHAVWGTDILAAVPADALRYHVCRTNPEFMQSSFSLASLSRTLEEELAGTWGGTVNRFLAHMRETRDGVIPAAPDPDLQAQGLLGWARESLERQYGLEQFTLRGAAATLGGYVEGCAAFLDRRVLAPAAEARLREVRAGSAGWLLTGLAVFAAPILPDFAGELWEALGRPGSVHQARWDEALRPPQAESRAGAPREWYPRPRPVELAAVPGEGRPALAAV
ncbi:MAG TPA: class I tRNA ligase family protein [Longimicrobium sp.]